MRQTITAIIPAHNEEENILRCIESLDWCDEIQVLWSGQDKTGAIARKAGAEVVERYKTDNPDFVIVQKNINAAIKQAKTDWILRIDADEVVTKELEQEIITKLTQETSTVAYGVPRKQFFWGGFLAGGDWAYDRLVRLFRKDSALYEPIVPVHEQLQIKGDVGTLKQPLLHYSHPDLHTALHKFNIYTTAEIKSLYLSRQQAIVKMLFVPPYVFLRWFIWHQGYKDGIRGIVAGVFRAFYDFMLYAKYIEAKYKKN